MKKTAITKIQIKCLLIECGKKTQEAEVRPHCGTKLNACIFCLSFACPYRPLFRMFYHPHELSEDAVVRLIDRCLVNTKLFMTSNTLHCWQIILYL
ncbi:MAG TPA: hypothetical protein VGJ48_21735 [Pyrinomonadaceae bacterium]